MNTARLIILTVFATLILVNVCNAQVSEEWVARRVAQPATGFMRAADMCVDAAGNVYATGTEHDPSIIGARDIVTVKYSPLGTLLWEVTYDGVNNGSDIPTALHVGALGYVYVCGYSTGAPEGQDYTVIKYDPSGNEVWSRNYDDGGTDQNDWAWAITSDDSGNVYTTGSSYDVNFDVRITTIKYDSMGNVVWVRHQTGSGINAMASAIVVNASGQVVISGAITDPVVGWNFRTAKYDASGTEMWSRSYNGPDDSRDWETFMAVDTAGNVYVTGGSLGDSTFIDVATIKYDANGTELWAVRYDAGFGLGDIPKRIAVDGAGSVIVTGQSSPATLTWDYLTIKYDASGTEQWVQKYSGPLGNENRAYGLSLDGGGNIYVTGESWGGTTPPDTTGFDYATIKYSPAGTQEWIVRYDAAATTSDRASRIRVDAAGGIVVFGDSNGELATVKYSQVVTAVDPTLMPRPNLASIQTIYPNPFNPATLIVYEVKSLGPIQLDVFDVSGRYVATLVDGRYSPGTYRVTWDGRNSVGRPASSGVYFAVLRSESGSGAHKMVLLK